MAYHTLLSKLSPKTAESEHFGLHLFEPPWVSSLVEREQRDDARGMDERHSNEPRDACGKGTLTIIKDENME
jgi:hypothetical protein